MIKVEATVCGKITRSAFVKNNNEGESFLSFDITVPITGRDDSKKDLVISVTTDGGKGEKGAYVEDRLVKVQGTLYVHKKDGNTYYNLRADKLCELVNTTEEESIEGEMEFTGKIGSKGIEDKTDKKRRNFKAFSAFSSEKNGEQREFTWVRFLYFRPKDNENFLDANSYIIAKGNLRLELFNDEIHLVCLISSIEPWILENK